MATVRAFSLNNSTAAQEVCVIDDGSYAYLGVGTLNPTHPFEVAVGGAVVYSIDTTGAVASALPATKGYAYTGTAPAIKAGTGTSAGTFWTVTAPAGGASSTAAGGAGASIIYTTGAAGASISGGGAGGDYTINLGAGTGTGRSGYFIVNAGSTGPFDPLSVNGWAQFNATIIAADASQGRSVVSNVLASGLTADYAGQTSAMDGAFTTDTSAFNYTGIIRGTMGHVYIQTTGAATVAFAEGVAGVVQINAGAAGTLTAGYGTAGELVANATGYTITAFNGVQGVVNAAGATNITTANAVYGKAATVAASGGIFATPIGGYFLAQQNDSTTITLAKGAEHVVNQNDAGLGGAITNAWVTHSHYESQTSATGVVPTVILHNLATAHRAATTITSLQGINSAISVNGASSIITTVEDIRVQVGTMTGTIPTHRGMRISNIGSAKTTTSEAIRIDAQSGSTGLSYALNILGGNIVFTPVMTVASATSAVWDGISVPATTLTLSGSTAITTAAGVNLITVAAPTLSAGSALTVTNAASLTVLGAPIAGGAGPATITNAYSFWVQAGLTFLAAGATISGATTSINASSNFATNINTGNSTGAVSIGNSAVGLITVSAKPAVAAAFKINDATNSYYSVDTRVATDNVTANSLGATGPSYVSANGSTFTNTKVTALTTNWTGGVTVTAAEGLQLYVDASTITAGQATTITAASGAIFAGLKPGTNATITTGIHVHLLDGPTKVGTYTNQVGIKIDALAQGATVNTALWVQNPIQVGNATVGTTNNQIHTATQGAGTTQLFIGNASINVTSDARLKTDIVNTVRDPMAIFNALRVVDFTWNDPADQALVNRNSRGRWTGMIAQEMVEVVPWIINKPGDTEKDYYFVEYHHLVPLMVKGFQDVDSRLTRLEALVANQ